MFVNLAARVRLLKILFQHVIVPGLLIYLLGSTGRQDSATWLLVLFAAATYVAYVSLAGAWSWFGIHTQKALALLLAATAVVSRPRVVAVNTSAEASELRLLCLGAGVFFLVRTFFVLLGRRAGKPLLQLAFPLKGGRYIIGQGGSSRALNRHARNTSQRYAVDIVKLGRFGLRAAGLYPTDVKSYAIFGDDVFSPCDGLVVAAVDQFADRVPSERDSRSPAGNYVAIETEDATIYLAHLMQGSVAVDAGQRVRAGQRLGRVGNSGNTTEPHLHVHAEKGPFTGTSSGAGLPLGFGGRFLVRNDVVDA